MFFAKYVKFLPTQRGGLQSRVFRNRKTRSGIMRGRPNLSASRRQCRRGAAKPEKFRRLAADILPVELT